MATSTPQQASQEQSKGVLVNCTCQKLTADSKTSEQLSLQNAARETLNIIMEMSVPLLLCNTTLLKSQGTHANC
jgi:hypothetical protein